MRPAPTSPLCFRNQEDAVKGQWMLAIVSVAAVLAGPPAWAQNPPAPTEPAPKSDRPLGDDEAMVLNFEHADIREVIHSLATALGISYTLDPRIEGQVTIPTTALQPNPAPERHRRRQDRRHLPDPSRRRGQDARDHPAPRAAAGARRPGLGSRRPGLG